MPLKAVRLMHKDNAADIGSNLFSTNTLTNELKSNKVGCFQFHFSTVRYLALTTCVIFELVMYSVCFITNLT